MIVTFGDAATEALFHGRTGRTGKGAKRIPIDIHKVAIRKLDIIDAARELRDLRAPPGNRLEALKGNLRGKHSIRVNEQWRIVFRWDSGDAHEVSILDYH
ncbi:MAG: type II toxin-antitoxin system RelE/ParE family toxin [Actinomycetota bacterium]